MSGKSSTGTNKQKSFPPIKISHTICACSAGLHNTTCFDWPDIFDMRVLNFSLNNLCFPPDCVVLEGGHQRKMNPSSLRRRQRSLRDFDGFARVAKRFRKRKRTATCNTDRILVQKLHEFFDLRKQIEELAGKCPLKDMQYREMIVEVILRAHHPDWNIQSVSNARGGHKGELPEDAFDLKIHVDDQLLSTVECKSGHITSGNISLSTKLGTYSDLPDKLDRYVLCDSYTYAGFFKGEVIPALLVVVKGNGHAKHADLLLKKKKAVIKKTKEKKKSGEHSKGNQQNGSLKLGDFTVFDTEDLDVYRYGDLWSTCNFLTTLSSAGVFKQCVDYDRTYEDFCLKHFGNEFEE